MEKGGETFEGADPLVDQSAPKDQYASETQKLTTTAAAAAATAAAAAVASTEEERETENREASSRREIDVSRLIEDTGY